MTATTEEQQKDVNTQVDKLIQLGVELGVETTNRIAGAVIVDLIESLTKMVKAQDKTLLYHMTEHQAEKEEFKEINPPAPITTKPQLPRLALDFEGYAPIPEVPGWFIRPQEAINSAWNQAQGPAGIAWECGCNIKHRPMATQLVMVCASCNRSSPVPEFFRKR